MAKKNKSTNSKQDVFVSVIVVATEQLVNLKKDVANISKLLAESYTNYEVIIVNNNAPVHDVSEITKLLDSMPCIRIVHLARPSRYDTALFAGLDLAIGDYVCTINPATDPIKRIKDIIKENKKNHVIQGVSNSPISGLFGTQVGRRLFYWYNRKYVGVDIPVDATFFAAYSRTAINALMASKRKHRHIRHLIRIIGYRPVVFDYTPLQNPARHRTMRTGAVEALEIAANYSTHPLRFVTWLGFFAGIVNILYALYIVFINLTKTQVTEGWTTTSLQLSGMFFILFTIMVILAEYIGRILSESQHEPEYYIVDEQNSTIGIADQDRRNIEN